MATMMMRKSAMGTARSARSVAARVSTSNKKTVSSKTTVDDAREYLLSMPGITAPFPDVFDPAGFTNNVKLTDLKRWRESEVTHGRVAMLAALGFIVGEQLEDFPAFVNYDGHITGPAITHFQQVRQGFWEPLLICIGLAESYRVALGWATPTGNGFNALKDEYTPGDLGFDPLGLKPSDPEELKTLQTKELNNGRLAMIAIAAFVVQELVEQTEIFEHLALRFEREVIEEIDDVELELGLPTIPVPPAI